MQTSAILAGLHYLALGIGFGSLFARGLAIRALIRKEAVPHTLKRLFFADNAWGFAALLWLSTGLLRAFGGLEKGTAYYMANPLFHLKLGLFLLLFLLETWPMVVFIRWRIGGKRGTAIPGKINLPGLRLVNDLELIALVLMVFVATSMARGLGL